MPGAVTEGWFDETLYPEYRQSLKAGTVLFRRKTEFQDLVIFENPRFGRVLALDGVVQTTEGDEFIYHEMIAHVPILAHGGARRVLIIGGGDGGTLREVLKHRVETAVMVEIDPGVIKLSREYLPSLSAGAFDDPRARIVIADGVRFVTETAERFDVIIVDSTDPAGPGEVLFTEQFYRDCKRCLAPGGVMVTQSGVPFMQPEELRRSARRLRVSFKDVSCYLAPVPTYACGPMTLGWATDADLRNVPVETLRRRFSEAGFATRYYTPDVHTAAFVLPPLIASLVE